MSHPAWRPIISTMSLPSRECGLKLGVENDKDVKVMVTPFAGVWIEIAESTGRRAGDRSLPSRECGLKLQLKQL